MKKETEHTIKFQKDFINFDSDQIAGVELYRSCDPNTTAIYFTKVEDSKRETAQAWFYVAFVSFINGQGLKMFIRYPDSDYFIEIFGGGFWVKSWRYG